MSNDSSEPVGPVGSVGNVPVTHGRLWYAAVALLGTVFVFVGAQLVAGMAVSIYPALLHWQGGRAQDWLSSSTSAQFFFILIAEALTLAGVWLLLKTFNWSWRTIGLRRPKLKHIGLGVLALVPYFALYMLITTVVSMVYPNLNVNEQQQIGFNHTNGTLELAAVFISLVILPPLTEEIIMRGYLYSGMKRAMPKVAAALVVSGLFGLAHLTEGKGGGLLWIVALDTFSLSLVLVYLREKTGNLWAGITLHALKNGIAFVSLFIIGVK